MQNPHEITITGYGQLDVYRCGCGFIIGMDAKYTGPLNFDCPTCDRKIRNKQSQIFEEELVMRDKGYSYIIKFLDEKGNEQDRLYTNTIRHACELMRNDYKDVSNYQVVPMEEW